MSGKQSNAVHVGDGLPGWVLWNTSSGSSLHGCSSRSIHQVPEAVVQIKVAQTSQPGDAADSGSHPPSSKQLFLGFLGLGMISFGGALPLARRMVVDKHRWLDEEQFTELLGLCQFLPGGNIINLSVALGMRFRGLRGALAAITGLIAVPSLVVILLGILYEHYQYDPNVKHLFAGLAAAAAGLLVQMAVKIVLPLRKNLVLVLLAALCFAAIAVFRFPLLWTMLVMTPICIVVTVRLHKSRSAS